MRILLCGQYHALPNTLQQIFTVDRNCLLCIIKCDAEAIVLIRGGVGYQTETRGQLTLMVASYTEVCNFPKVASLCNLKKKKKNDKKNTLSSIEMCVEGWWWWWGEGGIWHYGCSHRFTE